MKRSVCLHALAVAVLPTVPARAATRYKLPDGSLGFVTRETVTTAYQDFYAGRCTAIK
jgi:hypothetical protein